MLALDVPTNSSITGPIEVRSAPEKRPGWLGIGATAIWSADLNQIFYLPAGVTISGPLRVDVPDDRKE